MTTYSQTNLQNSHLANFWWFLWLTMVYYRSSNMSKSGTMGFHCTVDLQQLSTERPAFIKGFPSGPPECPKASHMMSYVWSFTPWPSWPLHMFHSCAAFSAFNFPDLSPTWLRLQNNTGGGEKRVRFPKRTIEIYRQKRFCQCSWHQMNVCISQNDFPIEWLIEWFMLRMNFPSAGYVPFWRSNVSYELTGKIKPAKQETLTTVYWRLLKKTRETNFDTPTTWPSSPALICCSCNLRFLTVLWSNSRCGEVPSRSVRHLDFQGSLHFNYDYKYLWNGNLRLKEKRKVMSANYQASCQIRINIYYIYILSIYILSIYISIYILYIYGIYTGDIPIFAHVCCSFCRRFNPARGLPSTLWFLLINELCLVHFLIGLPSSWRVDDQTLVGLHRLSQLCIAYV
jgi:hypothetical protein